jgi:hypothetical protein
MPRKDKEWLIQNIKNLRAEILWDDFVWVLTKHFGFKLINKPGSLPCPDSAAKCSTGYVTLKKNWTKYTIKLTGNLSKITGGFGWVTNASQNGNKDIKFFLDKIQYNKSRLEEKRFLVSFKNECINTDGFDVIHRNVAFTYDNAMALLVFLATGQSDRAKLLADALIYAQKNDRWYNDGRLRNAYQAGDLISPPCWTPNGKVGTVRMPGYHLTKCADDGEKECYPDCGTWCESPEHVGISAGNMAWAMLALLRFYELKGKSLPNGQDYKNAAIAMGEWVEMHCRSNSGGYTWGYLQWEPNPEKQLYKSTEHNIDLYAAFMGLYKLTNEAKWLERAHYAKAFVAAMWQPEGYFWAGTDKEDNPNTLIPLDCIPWAILAFTGADRKKYLSGLDYAEAHHKVGCGYAFSNFDTSGIWYEGTGQMAVAYKTAGDLSKYQDILNCLHAAQNANGGLPAASKDRLDTGIPGWLYYKRLHVGATAWLILAEKMRNPFQPRMPVIP